MQEMWSCAKCDMVFAKKRLLKRHEYKHLNIYVVRRRGRLAPGQPLSVPPKRVTGICGLLGILATV